MTDKNDKKQISRRKFIKTAGKAAVVAPAASLIVNAANADELPTFPSGRLRPDPCQTINLHDANCVPLEQV